MTNNNDVVGHYLSDSATSTPQAQRTASTTTTYTSTTKTNNKTTATRNMSDSQFMREEPGEEEARFTFLQGKGAPPGKFADQWIEHIKAYPSYGARFHCVFGEEFATLRFDVFLETYPLFKDDHYMARLADILLTKDDWRVVNNNAAHSAGEGTDNESASSEFFLRIFFRRSKELARAPAEAAPSSRELASAPAEAARSSR